MTVRKLSQIATSPSNLAATDFLVGVTAGNVDYRFSPAQIGAASDIIVDTTPIIGGSPGHLLYDNVGTVGEAGSLTFATGVLTISANGPGVLYNDTGTNGVEWNLGAEVKGTTPLFRLYDVTDNKTDWASSLDGAGAFTLRSGAVYGWTSNAAFADVGTIDTGISRISANTIVFGNGTVGDHSGVLNGGGLFVGSDTYANRNAGFGNLQVLSNGVKDGLVIQQAGIVAWRMGLRASSAADQNLYFNANSDTIESNYDAFLTATGSLSLGGNLFPARLNNFVTSSFSYNNSIDLGGPFGSGTVANIAFNLNGGFGGGGDMIIIASFNVFNTGDIGFAFQPPGSGGTVLEDGNNGLYLSTSTAKPIYLTPNRTIYAKVMPNGSFVLQANGALATNATDGFTYIPTCAGTPTGTPTTQTGAVPLVYDTTNNQFWIYNGGAWRQPKTPGGAAIVNWQ